MTHQPFAIPALLVFIVAVPLALGLIPPNRLYGFRTRRTLSSARVWYPVNRFGGVAVMIASVAYALVAIAVPYRGAAAGSAEWGIHLAAFLIPLVLAVTLTLWYERSF
jgi:uncharacterized membrane protein